MMKNISELFFNSSKFNYKKSNNLSKKNEYVLNIQFSTKSKAEADKNVESGLTKNQLQYVMPFYVRFMGGLITIRKKLAMDKLKPLFLTSKFVDSIRKIMDKSTLKDTKQSLELIKKRADCQKARDTLKNCFRKYRLNELRENLFKPTAKLLKMLYFIRVAAMHNQNADDKFLNQLIKRWRFMAHVKKLSKNKLQAIYKNMQLSYLNMAEEIFGNKEDEANPSLVDDIADLTEKLGVYANPKDRATPRARKKYVFDDLIAKDPNTANVIEETKQEEEIVLDKLPPKNKFKAPEKSLEKTQTKEINKSPAVEKNISPARNQRVNFY
jgi:hypothetical protein